MKKLTMLILLIAAILILAACGQSVPPQPTTPAQEILTHTAEASPPPVTTAEYTQEEYIQEEEICPNTTRISLGETFQLGDLYVTLGNEIEFVTYVNTALLYRHRYMQVPDGRKLYIPVTITGDEIDAFGSSIWLVRGAVYSRPGEAYTMRTAWHNPGWDERMHLFPWRDTVSLIETYVQLSYSQDGLYTLQFIVTDTEPPWEITHSLELRLDISWPESYTSILIEHIPGQTNEPFRVGNFEMVVGSDFTILPCCGEMSAATTVFPVTITNIGTQAQHLSLLDIVNMGSNSGYPEPIHSIYFELPDGCVFLENTSIPISEMAAIASGEQMDFYLPIVAVVCEITAWYRSFRLMEVEDAPGRITVRRYYFDIRVSGE